MNLATSALPPKSTVCCDCHHRATDLKARCTATVSAYVVVQLSFGLTATTTVGASFDPTWEQAEQTEKVFTPYSEIMGKS